MTLPTYDALFSPAIAALRALGGSASNAELDDRVATDLGLTDDELATTDRRGRSVFGYRMTWAKSYLKGFGLIDNSQRGVWSLTEEGSAAQSVDGAEVRRFVVKAYNERRKAGDKTAHPDDAEIEEGAGAEADWRLDLMDRLLALTPAAFEGLAQRLLRESGFVDVNVTGRSGDGGIDGTGILRLAGLITFPVLFQCKRWQGTVGSREVRDLRGAMQGRTEHGLIITTGTFSRDARAEAVREGAPPVDLIDGEQLLDELKRLQIGVFVRSVEVEEISVEARFFDALSAQEPTAKAPQANS